MGKRWQESRGRRGEALEERSPHLPPAVCPPALPSATASGPRALPHSARVPGPAADQGLDLPGTRAFPTDATGATLPRPQAVAVPPPASSCVCGCTECRALSSGCGQAIVPPSAVTLEAITIAPCYTCGSHTVREQVWSEPSPSTPSL